ncbi:hypothetical protein B9Z65_6604 [Elsinoe australis]|uniref:AB hydrolase-1 domain-containing protein n=1 Tax=Elsinoe australis TaxID=40998 RepID=A0A2P8ADN6_9PEZI|nr:hypothetical protein B9Z65_6604 [Elsinoe australis]
MAATNNPMISGSMASVPNPNPVSATTLHIAGILTTVHGLDLLPPSSDVSSVAVLWLLHPRLQTQEYGTARDVSLLLDYLPSYIFPHGDYTITQNLVLGISLGGHAAWHCLLQEPRISTAVVVIGCPDYTRLMTDRAVRSKLQTATASSPSERTFVGSPDFPRSLVEQVEKYDPAGLLLGELDTFTGDDWKHEPSELEKTRLMPILRDKLAGKRVLALSGGKDKLVPPACGEPFYLFLSNAKKWMEGSLVLEYVIDPEAGHEYSAKMREAAVEFICRNTPRSSKM